jgi:hypothetical protein
MGADIVIESIFRQQATVLHYRRGGRGTADPPLLRNDPTHSGCYRNSR